MEDANGRDESGLLHGDVVWEGDYELCKKVKGPVSGKLLSPIVSLSMEKTMFAKVISKLKSLF